MILPTSTPPPQTPSKTPDGPGKSAKSGESSNQNYYYASRKKDAKEKKRRPGSSESVVVTFSDEAYALLDGETIPKEEHYYTYDRRGKLVKAGVVDK